MRNRSFKWFWSVGVLPTRGQVRVTQRHWLQELWRRHRRLYNAPRTFFSATHKTRISLKSSSASEVTAQPIRKTPHSHHADLRAARRVHIHHSRRSCLHPEATRATSAAKNRSAHTAHATTLRMNRVRGGITLRHGSRMCGAPLGNACSSSRQDTRREGLRTSRDVTRGWPQLGSSAATWWCCERRRRAHVRNR